MTLAEIRTAVQARGFSHIGNTELDRWINQAYQELCEEAQWPFLEVSTTGTAPLAIADLRTVLSVSDTTQGTVLEHRDRRDLVELDPEMNETGTPEYFFLSDNTVSVYPLNTTDTIAVRYIEVPDELDDDADVPDVPERYHELIVDGAVIRCYKTSDEWDVANALRVDWEAGVGRMRRAILGRNLANTGRIVITDYEGWSV